MCLPEKHSIHQRAGGQRAAALGGERAVAVQGVVDVDDAALAVGADRNAAAHVNHDEIGLLVGHAQFAGGAAGGRTLRKGVETALPLEGRMARIPRQRPKLVHHHRVGNKRRRAALPADFLGQRCAEARRMLAPAAAPQVAEHPGVDAGTRRR